MCRKKRKTRESSDDESSLDDDESDALDDHDDSAKKEVGIFFRRETVSDDSDSDEETECYSGRDHHPPIFVTGDGKKGVEGSEMPEEDTKECSLWNPQTRRYIHVQVSSSPRPLSVGDEILSLLLIRKQRVGCNPRGSFELTMTLKSEKEYFSTPVLLYHVRNRKSPLMDGDMLVDCRITRPLLIVHDCEANKCLLCWENQKSNKIHPNLNLPVIKSRYEMSKRFKKTIHSGRIHLCYTMREWMLATFGPDAIDREKFRETSMVATFQRGERTFSVVFKLFYGSRASGHPLFII